MFARTGVLPDPAVTSAAVLMALLWVHRCACKGREQVEFVRTMICTEIRFWHEGLHVWGANARADCVQVQALLRDVQVTHGLLLKQVQHFKEAHGDLESELAPLRDVARVFATFSDAWGGLIFEEQDAASETQLSAEVESWLQWTQ